MSTTPRRIGKYELQKLLGSGSVGEVWKSYDLQYRHNVTIKIFYIDLQSDPNFMKRLLSRGQALASLSHPNIVRIIGADVSRSAPMYRPLMPPEENNPFAYMVMEYIEGITLAHSIQNTSRRGAFPPVSDIVHLFTQLGAAIDYAHEHGIIHGNIKPANILLRLSVSEEMKDQSITGGHQVPRPYGEPMLTDFGIIQPTNGDAINRTPTAFYISPEQAKGLPPTRHSDIYSLGVMLYEICTGVPPFRSESPVVLMMQHINMQPISPTLINPNIPSELSTVILRALAKDSGTCFSSASQMQAALADACSVPTELNNATVEAKESGYAITSRSRRIETRSARSVLRLEVPSADVSALGRSTGPISTILGVATLPVHASQSPQLQSSRITRPLSMVPDRPAALDTDVGTVGSRLSAPRAERVSISSGLGEDLKTVRNEAKPLKQASMPNDPVALGRASFTGEKELETPPAMAVIPSSRIAASLSHAPSVPLRPLSLPSPKKVRRLPPIYVWLAVTLLLVIIGSVVGMLSWLHSQSAPSSSTVVGHIFFQSDSFGRNDVVRIELQNIEGPPPGKSYYAWLVINGQGNQPTPTLLGELPVSSGQVSFLYPGDAHHSDLLAGVSGLLITEEDANGVPSFPSSKQVYRVEFAQAMHPTDANHLSVLDYVRDLLSDEQALKKLGISGSLAEWLLRDTSKAWLWASNARDYWQGTQSPGVSSGTVSSALGFIRGQIVHIVDVLEGKQFDSRDASIARVGMLEQNALAPDYLDASLSHLNAIAAAADATADQKARALTISGELQQMKNWLQKVHQDAMQLLSMTDQQFTQPQTQSLLDDMAMQANYAYNGQNDLPANTMQHPGMAQIYNDMQRLATFEIKVSA